LVAIKKLCAKILLLTAELSLSDRNFASAAKRYRTLINSFKMEPSLKARFLFQLLYSLYKKRDERMFDRVTKEALASSEIYPSTYNLVAYYYAKRGKSLDLAMKMVDKALFLVPNCPYYLDTKAMILYKKGEFFEAIEYLNEALLMLPNDRRMMKHLSILKKAIGVG